MNERTLRVLEFDKVREMLAEQASSSLGQERARRLRPHTDKARIQRWLDETSEARRVMETAGSWPLGGLQDIRPALHQAAIGGILEAAELRRVGDLVRCARRVADFLSRQRNVPLLQSLLQPLDPCPGLLEEIERCLDEDSQVRDTASPELQRLRRRLRTLKDSIYEKAQQILAAPEYARMIQDFLLTSRDGRVCIPIKSEFQTRFPGLVHDTSASGATVFMEPEPLVVLGNQLRQTEGEEQAEVERILRALTEQVGAHAEALQANLTRLSILDFIVAKARLSVALEAVSPQLNSNGFLDLRQARHPLLIRQAGEGTAVVPIDLQLGREFHTLIITGPNTGGKTVALKTVGLLTLMAQSGLHVPAAPGTELAVFQQVFADIGDEQSLEQSLSTFSSHLGEIAGIVRSVQRNALVLLDEIGAGTDPAEGAALARALLQYLHQRGVRTIATTHYSELKTFASTEPGIENARVEFDGETLRPTYRLRIGMPGSSHAFTIAERLGLPRSILTVAQSFLPRDKARADEFIVRMEQTQQRLDHELSVAARESRTLEELRRELQAELQRQREMIRQIQQQAQEEAQALVQQAYEEARRILADLRRQQREGKATEAARQRLRELQATVAEFTPSPALPVAPPPSEVPSRESPSEAVVWTSASASPELHPGDPVRVGKLNQNGTVLHLPTPEEVEVQVGSLRLILPRREVVPLEPPAAPSPGAEPLTPAASLPLQIEKSFGVPDEIHLLGMTVEEALLALDKYLDDVFLSGRPTVRIIHGKGTGALREAVRRYLRHHPYVASFGNAQAIEGGIGATVVELRTE